MRTYTCKVDTTGYKTDGTSINTVEFLERSGPDEDAKCLMVLSGLTVDEAADAICLWEITAFRQIMLLTYNHAEPLE